MVESSSIADEAAGSDGSPRATMNESNRNGDSISISDGIERQGSTLDHLPPASIFAPDQLPVANISRLMKQTLPPSYKISREAKETMSVFVSEFILFLTSEASDRCADEKRKTITGEDLLNAMKTLGFEHYEMVCRIWLSKNRAVRLKIDVRMEWYSSSWNLPLQAQGIRPRGRPKSASKQAAQAQNDEQQDRNTED